MEYINKTYQKYKKNAIAVLLFLLVLFVLENLVDWDPYKISISEPVNLLNKALRYEITINFMSLLSSILVVAVSYKTYRVVVFKKSGLKIINATYGASGRVFDISSELNSRIRNNRLVVLIDNSIAGDPIPGIKKAADVEYEYKGKKRESKVNEYEVLELPVP